MIYTKIKQEITKYQNQSDSQNPQNEMTCIEYKDYTDQFKLISKLGDGNCASVLKVQDIKTKKQFALKYSKLDSPAKLALAFQEIEVIRALDHPNAIEIHYYFVKSTPGQQFAAQNIQLGIIMELADRSLEQDILIRRKKQRYYSQEQIINILKSLLSFFAHAQQKGYLHRDIKPANILIMWPTEKVDPATQVKEKLKVCDFGFAIKNHKFSDKNIAGTASYASPKILSKFQNSQIFVNGNNYKDDVYSLGITMLQLCTLQSAELVSPRRLLAKTNHRYGLRMASLLKSMIEFDENKRQDFVQLKESLPKYLPNLPSSLINPLKKKEDDDLQLRQNRGFQDFILNVGKDLKQNHTASSSYSCQNIKNEVKMKQACKLARGDELMEQLRNQGQKHQHFNKEQENINNKNCTPKTTPNMENQFDSQERVWLKQPKQDYLTSNDKAKTKRRSKLINNYPAGDKFFKESLATKGIYELPIKLIASMKKQSVQKGTNQQRQGILSIKEQKIMQVEVIEVRAMEKENQKTLNTILCLNAGNKFYVASSLLKTQFTEIKISESLSSVQFLKQIPRRQQVIIICKNGTIATINPHSILNVILQPEPLITYNHIRILSIESSPLSDLAVVDMSASGKLLKGYNNGSITENDKLILETNWKGRISFIQRLEDSLYVGTRDGIISKFKVKDSFVSGSNSILAYYNCKSSIIGFNFEAQSKQTLLTLVSSTGFVFRLDSNLDNIRVKRISKDCLRVCSFNSKLEHGSRILAVDSKGNIINELGCLVHQSNLPNINDLKIFEKGKKLLLGTDDGFLYQVSLPNIDYPSH